MQRFGLAARHLGQFTGRYLTGTALPEYPWLTRGRVRGWLAHGGPWLGEPMRTRRRPGLLSTWLTDEVLDRMDALWAERQALLEAFDELPVTLCHHDAHRRNLGSRWVGGRECTTVLDWQLVGTGHLGEEVAALVAVSLQFMDVPITDVAAFERASFDEYLAGLHDAGWDGDPDQGSRGVLHRREPVHGVGRGGHLVRGHARRRWG